MSKTIKEERLRWLMPIAKKRITLKYLPHLKSKMDIYKIAKFSRILSCKK